METEHADGSRALRAALALAIEAGPPPDGDVCELLRRGRQWRRRRRAAAAGSLVASTLAVVAAGSLTLGATPRRTATGPAATSRTSGDQAPGTGVSAPSKPACQPPDSDYLARRHAFHARVDVALSDIDGTVGEPVPVEGERCVAPNTQSAIWSVHRAGRTGAVIVAVTRLDEKGYRAARSGARCTDSPMNCDSTTLTGGALLRVSRSASTGSQPAGERWDILYVRPDRITVAVTDTSTEDFGRPGLGTAPLGREQAVALATDPGLTS